MMTNGAECNDAWSLLQRYRALPEPVRIIVTAFIGAAVGFATYQLIYAFNPLEPRTTTSWLLAFLVNIVRQHGLHRRLTFLNSGPYWPSLRRAYVMYSGSAVATTALNWFLTTFSSLNHNVIWAICMGLTATISLLFLKRFVFGIEANQVSVNH
jgi:branched-subunit amino acid ABC-type transport system permease component